MNNNVLSNIDPEAALRTIDQSLSQINATRESHLVLQNCIGTLNLVIQDWKNLRAASEGNKAAPSEKVQEMKKEKRRA